MILAMETALRERLEALQTAVDVSKSLVEETFLIYDEQPMTLSRLNLLQAAIDRLEAHYNELENILEDFKSSGVTSSIPQAGTI